MWVLSDTRNSTAQLSWNVGFFYSYDGSTWTSSRIALFAPITGGSVPIVHPAYSTVTNFGLRIRLVLAWRSGNGSQADSANVSATLALQSKT